MKTTRAQRATMRAAFEKAGQYGSLALLDDLDQLLDHITMIANNTIGAPSLDADPIDLLDAIATRLHEHRIAASVATRAERMRPGRE